MKVSREFPFHKLCAHVHWNKTKFEWSISLKYYHVIYMGKTKHKSYPIRHEQQRSRDGTRRSHTSNIVPARLAESVWCTSLNFRPYSWIFTFVSVGSSPRSYLHTSATGRLGVHTAPKYDAKPIKYVPLHFWDRRDAASLRHRNCSATTVFVCERKPYLVSFSWRHKSYLV